MELLDICKRLINIDITVSEIAFNGDHLNLKGKAVNKCIKEMCKSNNVCFLKHTNIIPGTHLNRSKLHITQKWTDLLAINFVNVSKTHLT